MADWCVAVAHGIRLTVQATPNARKDEVIGAPAGLLKVRLQAPPAEGKANERLVRYLAATLKVARSSVMIVAGHGSRHKVVDIAASHLTVEAVRRALLPDES